MPPQHDGERGRSVPRGPGGAGGGAEASQKQQAKAGREETFQRDGTG
jgi:hypothetical protein